MGRPALSDHEKMDAISPLRVRGNPAQRRVWQEVGHSAESGKKSVQSCR